MAIVFDAASNGTGPSPLTVAHTCGATTAGLLCVVLTISGGATVSSIKYAGINMTLVDSALGYAGGTNQNMYAYYLLNPTTGTNNIVITMSSGSPTMAAASYKNVLINGVALDAHNTGGSDSGSSDATTVTTTTDNDWTILFAAGISGVTPGAGTGTTSRATNNGVMIGDSNGVIHPAGLTSMTATKSAGNPMRTVIAAFKPNDYSTTVSDTVTDSESLTTVKAISVSLNDTIVDSDSLSKFTDKWKTESKNSSSWTAETKSL